jgi:hypothetical protein
MTAFGIIASEFNGPDEHYVSDDEKLYEWLVANNYGPLEDSHYPVPAPEGYIFKCGSLFRKDDPELKGLDESELKDTEYVAIGSSENDKALCLLEGAMKSLTRKEFHALDLPEDRILEYMLY